MTRVTGDPDTKKVSQDFAGHEKINMRMGQIKTDLERLFDLLKANPTNKALAAAGFRKKYRITGCGL